VRNSSLVRSLICVCFTIVKSQLLMPAAFNTGSVRDSLPKVNAATKRLVGELRFTVERPGGGRVQIRDRTNPLRNDWFIDYYAPFMDIAKDYAMVLRAKDPKTEQMTVTAAGMSVFGTLAAGEFLTSRDEIRKLDAAAPRGWKNLNLEIVLSTQVIRGKPSPPTVVATHFW
jgi:hypothetical protein